MKAIIGSIARSYIYSAMGIPFGKLPNSLTKATTLLFLVGVLCHPVAAQNYLTMTGTPSFSAPEPVEYGFTETANGNLHLEFPLGSFPQRGSKEPYSLRLLYDSHIWQIYSGNGMSWGTTSSGNLIETGWSYTAATVGQLTESDYGSQ